MEQNVVIIDANKRAIKGYCKAKDFKEQFEKLKASLSNNSIDDLK